MQHLNEHSDEVVFDISAKERGTDFVRFFLYHFLSGIFVQKNTHFTIKNIKDVDCAWKVFVSHEKQNENFF